MSVSPTETPTPAKTSPTPDPPPQTSCADNALFIADVTIADNTRLQPGQSFTKTWQLRNTGTCVWNAGYALVFSGGDKMNSPASVALAETAPGASLDLSVTLSAPTADGFYTGLYEIHNPQGQAIPIGLTKIMWVKVAVGNVAVAQATTPLTPAAATATAGPQPTGGPTSRPKGHCKPEQYGVYTTQLLALINSARIQAGLRTLSVNNALAAAAQGHSDDMACHSLLSHSGSDGSSIYERMVAAGYSPSNWGEIIFGSGSAQQAFDWWMNDKPHREAILDPNVDDFGAGYSYVADSEYGGYFSVDFGNP